MIVRWIFFGSVAAVLEKDMLGYVNKFRARHKMEELHELSSLHDAAKMQATHMCTRGVLTHEGPDGDGKTLAGRLKRFKFVGLNVGENIAKQEDDDYTEVAKLWMDSEEHRNNILGDYAYSGIATCVGKDGNRYWVHVFGKDVSNAEIAKMRIRSEAAYTNRPDEEGRSNRIGDDDGIDSARYRQASDGKRVESTQAGDEGYLMVIKPIDCKDDQEFGTEYISIKDMHAEQERMQDKVGEGPLHRSTQGGEWNDNARLIGWNASHYNRQAPGAAASTKAARDRIKQAKRKQLSFGDYLIPESNDEEQSKIEGMPKDSEKHKLGNRHNRDANNQNADADKGRPKTIRLHTSTGSVVTLLFKNPEGSTMAPAIQSLIQLIKQADEGDSLTDRKQSSLYNPTDVQHQHSKGIGDGREHLPQVPMIDRKSLPDEEPAMQKSPWNTDLPFEHTLTVTTTKSEPTSTTTVYLPQHWDEATTMSPSKRASLSLPEQRAYERDLNDDEGWRDADKKQTSTNNANTNGNKGNKLIRPTVMLSTDRIASTQAGSGVRDNHAKGKDGNRRCIDGYNKDGSCIIPKEIEYNQDKLNNMLDDLVKKGRVHLHIVPDEQCVHGECQKEDNANHGGLSDAIHSKVDIGLPFSDRL
ncbi:hypothetical protein HK407_03g05110 [Ordospora pajunii]|uniref:uncharacterized protein n=1 Tax=Ordospora pajunii TaxID=3039483 RepID=UPI0029526424|nr:uncharacterized protein HK407_03g05110 [Ordospora pajunii]KAH9411761.1 hypothetical protein HK407_03g05110 [Ordospora pajunii]